MSADLLAAPEASMTGAPVHVTVPASDLSSALVNVIEHWAPSVLPPPPTHSGVITETAAVPPASATAICFRESGEKYMSDVLSAVVVARAGLITPSNVPLTSPVTSACALPAVHLPSDSVGMAPFPVPPLPPAAGDADALGWAASVAAAVGAAEAEAFGVAELAVPPPPVAVKGAAEADEPPHAPAERPMTRMAATPRRMGRTTLGPS